jgi:hypothetical protein
MMLLGVAIFCFLLGGTLGALATALLVAAREQP